MRAELLCFGTELLRDKTNTNINAVADRLGAVGIPLDQSSTLPDRAADVERALRESLRRSDIVLTSGGLGPTFDDLTRECVSKVVHRPLVFSPSILRQIRARFASVGRSMPAENERQAYVLKGARAILNRAGTAPGQILVLGKKTLVLLPGPPSELIPMLEKTVCPYLRKKYSPGFAETLVLHAIGRPESEIDERIAPVVSKNWSTRGVNVYFGILAHGSVIDVKATAESRKRSAVAGVLRSIRTELLRILGEDVYGENRETLEALVGNFLRKRRQTLAVAESCTGGLLSGRITAVPGSSDYFLRGIVTYSNKSKMELLGVRAETLQKFGAVSSETAAEMARGLLKQSGSDWALSVTGIAGPGGGTKAKPVGLVHFGLAGKKETIAVARHFHGNREEIRQRAVLAALDLLRRELED